MRNVEEPIFPHPDDAALLVDQYELTMLQAYWAREMHERAHFSLFVRRLPPGRNFLLACGLGTVLDYVEALRFTEEGLAYLRETGDFDPGFVDWLKGFRFTGDIRAVPEGTPLFPEEPILEVEAPLTEAQVIETMVMNQVHLQTVLASKAIRVRTAAGDRTVVDFGLRRMHGADAGLKAARAFHIAGIDATSNVLAGKI
jgi:nicotinate phosphoribosyltransferase